MTPHETVLFLYNLTLIPMTFFSILFLLFSLLSFAKSRKKDAWKTPRELPFVTIQIPTYNDPIATRCIERCLAMEYPRDKYEIIICDDSTNATTRTLLQRYARKNPARVKYSWRAHRDGYKPGALAHAMRHTQGELLVVFDADWIPGKRFLREVVRPFSDPSVAIVQTRQGFYNHKKNLISRFAAYTLMVYHAIMMPINNRANTVLFCGTAGAIRRSALDAVGGWNTESITEDSDLSVRMLINGYKSVYLQMETPSEVPETFEGFLRQQMRWCYGNTRVFIDHAPRILYRKGLTLRQRVLLSYLTLGNIIAPVVILMTVLGFLGWFVGDPALFAAKDLATLAGRFALTIGFYVMGFIALWRLGRLREFKNFVAATFTIGIVLAVANSVAFTKAITGGKLSWYCTPKHHNRVHVKE